MVRFVSTPCRWYRKETSFEYVLGSFLPCPFGSWIVIKCSPAITKFGKLLLLTPRSVLSDLNAPRVPCVRAIPPMMTSAFLAALLLLVNVGFPKYENSLFATSRYRRCGTEDLKEFSSYISFINVIFLTLSVEFMMSSD